MDRRLKRLQSELHHLVLANVIAGHLGGHEIRLHFEAQTEIALLLCNSAENAVAQHLVVLAQDDLDLRAENARLSVDGEIDPRDSELALDVEVILVGKGLDDLGFCVVFTPSCADGGRSMLAFSCKFVVTIYLDNLGLCHHVHPVVEGYLFVERLCYYLVVRTYVDDVIQRLLLSSRERVAERPVLRHLLHDLHDFCCDPLHLYTISLYQL